MNRITRAYRAIFPAVIFDDFEDYASKAIKTLFGAFFGLLLVIIALALNLGEKKEQIEKANQRIKTAEERLNAINKRIEALEEFNWRIEIETEKRRARK